MGRIEAWANLMEETFPLWSGDGLAELTLVPGSCQQEEQALAATIGISIYEPTEGGKQLRDVKEQPVYVGSVEALDDLDRYAAFLEAFRAVFADLKTPGGLEEAMPMQLFPSDVLDLEASTAEEFDRAIRSESWLGELFDEA